MIRYQDIGRIAVQLMLLTSLETHAMDTWHTTDAVDEAVRHIQSPGPGPHCIEIDVQTSGRHWAFLDTTQPSTAPALMAFGDGTTEPRPVRRVEAVLLEVDGPDTLTVCTTSQAPLAGGVIVVLPEGDDLEIEVDPDPLGGPGGVSTEGDDLEIEVDPDP